jgi:hypothetical protein
MPQVQREIVDRLGKCCLTLGHQQPLQTICSSLEAAASYLVYVMCHEAAASYLVYVMIDMCLESVVFMT